MYRTRKEKQLLFIIRFFTLFFIAALIVSGATAFPLEVELKLLCGILGISTDVPAETYTGFQYWIAWVYEGIHQTNKAYPFLAYGTDWLAFAHIGIAIAFIGVYVKPVRNIWIVYWAMILCVAIMPVIFICGAIRQIPFYWQLIDSSFGIFGIIPLLIMRHYIVKLEVLYPGKY
ncbi:hypothetical protein [Bacteroides sp. 519]|uniref:hypothetical protein n=1 Tax=Bacteroides sp. 519 TaxID=2302937 RepID=UPI0013D2D675|nr:hypothetical protein [Bacteroides sp. 519]NDV60488.1 hypothetical protein [Bacteroides sp. 519]